jgi:outer membrane receptor protein involved in Fe transport
MPSVSLAVLAACLMTVSAQAQTTASSSSASAQAPATSPAPTPQPATPAPAKTPPATTGGGAAGDAPVDEAVITVTAERPEVTHKADRDVYDVKQDPVSATGAAADVLNNIPAVTVDPDGTVGLRGNNNVQVYVNGKKVSQMQGDARAFTLQNLPGSDIDSVEVLTNPPASFGTDTAGGIINIVLKRGRNLRPTSYISASVGDQGKGSLAAQTGKTWGKLTLNGSIIYNQNTGGGGGGGGFGGGGGSGSTKSHSTRDQFRLDPTTGNVLSERQTENVNKNHSKNTRYDISGSYNLSDSETLTGEVLYNTRTGTSNGFEQTRNYDPSHNLTSAQARFSDSSQPTNDVTFTFGYDRRGEIGTDNDFKMQWQRSQTWSTNENLTRTLYETPARTDTLIAQRSKSNNSVDEFSGDWTHELSDTENKASQLQLGWDLTHTIDNRFTYRSQDRDVGLPELPNANSVKQFNDDQSLFAVYGLYEQKFDKLSVQGGVRFENLMETIYSEMPLLTLTPATSEQTRVNWSPSFNASYQMTQKDLFRFSYSKKLNRPRGQQLDPLIILSTDGLSARSGNPNLKAEKVDKYELTYNHDLLSPNRQNQGQGRGQGQGQSQNPDQKPQGMNLSYNMNLNYQSSTGAITQAQAFLPGGQNILLTTYQNAGDSERYGTQVGLNGSTPDRNLNFNVNYNYNYAITHSVDISTGRMITRKGPNSGGSFNVRYRMDQKNTLSVRANFTGEQVDELSRRSATTTVGLSYVHQIIPSKFLFTVNAQNVLESQNRKTFQESSVQRSFFESFDTGASVIVNLRYTFGKIIGGNRGQGGFRNGGGGGGGGGGGRGGGGGFGGGGGGGRGGF